MFATGGGQLRRKRTCSKQDACSYEEANQRRNGARPYCEGKTFCSKQSGSSYTEVEHLRNRRRSVAKKKDLFQTGCVQLRRSNTCSQRDAFNCDQVVRVRNRERSVTSKPASRCCSRILAPGPDPLSHKGALCQLGGQEAADLNNCSGARKLKSEARLF